MDGTFKLNQVAYLVVVCGVSDRGRSFHLVAIFITSPRLEGLYVKALTTLRRMSTAVTSKQLLLTYVMADAEAGQLNAVNQVFGVDSELTYLICFYHVMAKVHERLTAVSSMDSGLTYLICFYNVMAKVHERLKAVSSTLREQVVADIYDLHFASSKTVYDDQVVTVLARWSRDQQLMVCRGYFENMWMMSEFSRWQCFHTPGGYATTNNPVEQFNRLIKRDYTLRTKQKIGTLIRLLADCCGHQSVTARPFKDVPQATQQLKARVKDFRHRDLLRDMTPSRSSIEFLLESPNPNVVRVLPSGYQRVFLPELGRSREDAPISAQMGANYARMENEGQPDGGWHADLSKLTCGCKYHFKFAICIHVIFGLQVKYYTGLDGKRTLVNRSVPKKRRQARTGYTRVPAGRPRTNGHALSTE
ncbi:hypothetical protein PF008_g22788 [Phytophthora fragariae]|uniref:MULE transposase domain-containing protein n=1 Tax=Phytophthora fragariae TaxID=53985 RepID=A0A6G0QSQ0_9STRA|nr:hypothetical protein PF008_g22788 [Phytophthora fragariae]